jgi:DNA repair protein RadA/Sms
MAKVRTSYVCRECGNVQPKWMGKCPDCGAWDALERFVEREAADGPAPGALDLGGALGAGPGEAPAPGGSPAGGAVDKAAGRCARTAVKTFAGGGEERG